MEYNSWRYVLDIVVVSDKSKLFDRVARTRDKQTCHWADHDRALRQETGHLATSPGTSWIRRVRWVARRKVMIKTPQRRCPKLQLTVYLIYLWLFIDLFIKPIACKRENMCFSAGRARASMNGPQSSQFVRVRGLISHDQFTMGGNNGPCASNVVGGHGLEVLRFKQIQMLQ